MCNERNDLAQERYLILKNNFSLVEIEPTNRRLYTVTKL